MFNTNCLCVCEGRGIGVRGSRAVVALVYSSFLLFISCIFYAGRCGICHNSQGIKTFLKNSHFFNGRKLLFIKQTVLLINTLKNTRNISESKKEGTAVTLSKVIKIF